MADRLERTMPQRVGSHSWHDICFYPMEAMLQRGVDPTTEQDILVTIPDGAISNDPAQEAPASLHFFPDTARSAVHSAPSAVSSETMMPAN